MVLSLRRGLDLEYALRGVKLSQAKSRENKPKKKLPVTMDIMDKLRDFWEEVKDHHVFLWLSPFGGDHSVING